MVTEMGVGVSIKREHKAYLCGDGRVLYLDCSDGYMNLHVIKWHTIICTHIVPMSISWF